MGVGRTAKTVAGVHPLFTGIRLMGEQKHQGAAGARRPSTSVTMTKILLAEDDNDMRRFLVKALQNAGYEVISYDNGLSAYQRLREEPFELLLTDIVMPEMDGIELARRAAELDPDIKIMFITGFAAVALNSEFGRAQGRQGAVQARPPARPRQRSAEDAGGGLTAAVAAVLPHAGCEPICTDSAMGA